jgi:hypothetical protein
LTFDVSAVQSVSMNGRIFLWPLLLTALMGAGCDEVQQSRQKAYADIEGITLADLQAEKIPPIESLLSFSVLTYVLDAEDIGSLETLIDSLSQSDIHYDNVDAFEANGFSVGIGLHEEGASIAQKLQSAGAVRIGQGALMIPTNSNEMLFSETVTGSLSVLYSTSATGVGGATISSGKIGWIISGRQDAADADVVQVTLCPAFWRIGARDLRLLTGKEPYQFYFFDVGRVSVPMRPGQICLLGPERVVTEQDTLDRLLFEVPRRKQLRFFVIIYTGLRGMDGH